MKIEGWASVPEPDWAGHIVEPGAFAASIARKGLGGPGGVKLVIKHDMGKPAGVITRLEQRNGGLWLEALLDEGISWSRDWAAAVRVNNGLNFSVGFFILDADIVSRNGVEYLQIIRGELEEVSLVVEPANPHAKMTKWEDDA
ncbi:HK97 family phage prohead protease [Paracoccus sp. MBLB3053]|uniref:HK97 family phage prohead protease n=1 Tax=Paracoccus aurantius TaxID=3073814 RepID=A0ABU2HS02_9RHOB|nr:HK97 family phage prohead protease [Paracoccus sp. MBLB3053]MDS9467813.1 HK97 family phage prohead protease [Paracoccus sp. MBLB3053]